MQMNVNIKKWPYQIAAPAVAVAQAPLVAHAPVLAAPYGHGWWAPNTSRPPRPQHQVLVMQRNSQW